MSKKGKILKIHLGFNPNSSALAGPAVACLWASVVGGGVFMVMDAFLRGNSKTPDDKSKTPADTEPGGKETEHDTGENESTQPEESNE